MVSQRSHTVVAPLIPQILHAFRKGVQNPGGIRCRPVIIAHLQAVVPQRLSQFLRSLKIPVHGRNQFLSGHIPAKDLTVRRSQHIRSGCQSGTVQAPVVVHAALGDIPSVFQAPVKEQRQERGRNHIQVPALRHLAKHLFPDLPGQMRFQLLHVPTLRKMSPDRLVRYPDQGHGADVRNLHSLPGDNEFPARRHRYLSNPFSQSIVGRDFYACFPQKRQKAHVIQGTVCSDMILLSKYHSGILLVVI